LKVYGKGNAIVDKNRKSVDVSDQKFGAGKWKNTLKLINSGL
jgi:hypothetical protein